MRDSKTGRFTKDRCETVHGASYESIKELYPVLEGMLTKIAPSAPVDESYQRYYDPERSLCIKSMRSIDEQLVEEHSGFGESLPFQNGELGSSFSPVRHDWSPKERKVLNIKRPSWWQRLKRRFGRG